MGLHVDRFCEQTGLAYDKKSHTFWGKMHGYPVFLQNIPRRNSIAFRLIADMPAERIDNAFKERLEQYRMKHPGLAVLRYHDRCLNGVFSLAAKDTDNEAASAAACLTALAADEKMTPSCMSCGKPSEWSPYLLDGDGVTVCPYCRALLEQRIREAQEKKEKEPYSHAGIVLGAALGAVILFLVTFFVLKLSTLSVLLSYAGVALSFFLMVRFGKKLTVPAVVLGAALCLLAGVSASVLHYAENVAQNNRDNQKAAQQLADEADELLTAFEDLTEEEKEYVLADENSPLDVAFFREQKKTGTTILENQTLSDCLMHLPAILRLKVYQSDRTSLFRELVMTLITVLISTFITAPRMLAVSSGKHTLQELTV